MGEYASECKENLNQMFEDEADFRLRHLDQKNEFIQKYTQVGIALCRMPITVTGDYSST